jgi:phospholipid/cholesterol/gamma-HCH transport system substrate-binding protein
MALQNKGSWARLKVGIMALFAMVVLAVLIFLITGQTTMFQSKSLVTTYMDDSAALTEGSAVRLNGILIGKVDKIALSGSNEPQRIVRIDMEVADKWFPSIPVDSQAALGAENLLGTKFINIKKGRAPQTVKAGAEIQSLDTREFDDVVQQGYSLLGSLQGILKKVDAIVGQVEVGKGSIGKLLVDEEIYNKMLSIVNEVDGMAKAMSRGEGTVGKLLKDDKLYADVRGSLARIDSLVQGMQEGQGTAGKLLKDPALYEDMRATIKDVRGLLAGLERGEGSAGKLLKSPELHDKVTATIGKLDTMIDRINGGQGTLGQLMVNPQLYENLNGATREMHGLMKDFRANPKKFLRIQLKLF